MHRHGSITRGIILAVLAMSYSCMGLAGHRVDVILSGDGGPYTGFVSGLRESLNKVMPDVEIRVHGPDSRLPNDMRGTGVIVTAGVKAMGRLQIAKTLPVVHALIPASNRTGVASGGKSIYLYLDQPAWRVMRMIKTAFGSGVRIGIIFGGTSAWRIAALQREARQLRLKFDARRIMTNRDLFPVLREIVEEVDVFLVQPDKLVINPATLQSLLLTTYHAGIPLIGYSPAFTRIGAVMALYTTPYQAGIQTGEMVVRIIGGERIEYPVFEWAKYFNIRVNKRVADSLGMDIPDKAVLTRVLEKK